MLSSRDSDRPSYPFRFEVVQANGSPSNSSVIKVYDAWDVEMVKAEGSIELDLPRGLYTVRVTRAGELREKVIKHRGATSESLTEPMRTSAVPSFDTSGAHEYYSWTSAHWSTEDTRAAIGDNPEGRLFLFIRSLNRETYRHQPLAEYLQLFDESGNMISHFDPHETEFSSDGWLAFSAPAAPGLYLLTYAGDEPRELPLYVFPGLSTQFFAMYQGQLRLDTASVLLQKKNKSFSPDDRETQAFDSALNGLQQGRDLLPPGMMQMLLYGKFDHPMLGLLGAHVLLLREEVDEGLLDKVIGNLDHLLPNSPDVVALKILTAKRFGKPPPNVVVERPPMLRAGLDAVLTLAAEFDHVIPEGSLLDKIAARQRFDLPWTSWKPLGRSRDDVESIVNMAQEQLSQVEPVWVEQYIKEAQENAQQYGLEVDLSRMAADVGLPQRDIERTYSAVSSRRSRHAPGEADDLQQIRGLGPAMQAVLNRMGYVKFEDLAKIGDEELAYIMRRLGRYANRINKQEWVSQAQTLLNQKNPRKSS